VEHVIFMYINAVANSVMLQLYLRHDFYNVLFKIKHKLFIASGSGPPTKNSGCASAVDVTLNDVYVKWILD
jgi:hypothetical protein